MDIRKFEQLQKLHDEGFITEEEMKAKREKLISEILDSTASSDGMSVETKKEVPKRNIKILSIILICVAIFIGGIGILVRLIDDLSPASETSWDSSGEKIGKWYVLDRNYEIKVTSLKKKNYFEFGDYEIWPGDGNVFVSVYFSFRNVSDEPISHLALLSSEFYNFYLLSPDGDKYETDFEASLVLAKETMNSNGKYLKPFLKGFDIGKNGFAIPVPKDKLQEKGWKLVINSFNFDFSL